MYTFQLTDQFLSEEDQQVFESYLAHIGLDKSIWPVFDSLFESGVAGTKPILLKAYQDSQIEGACILIQCRRYGKALFHNSIASRIIDRLGIPFYLWINFGCCMDMMSNPGFVRNPEKTNEVKAAMIGFLKRKHLLTIINDYSRNSNLYPSASVLPALPHALIDTTHIASIDDYTKQFKNIRKKLKTFKKKGGEYILVNNQLNKDQLDSLKHCFVSTSEKSVFYLPYQDLYLHAAIHTGGKHLENVYYFVALLNGDFLGYQAALRTGNHLNALHGAFDRSRKTTYHAYDILFVKMTEFALENGLQICDFGAVLNYTKQKMVNETRGMSYFLLSKYRIVQRFFKLLLKVTKIQGSEQLKFKETGDSNT